MAKRQVTDRLSRGWSLGLQSLAIGSVAWLTFGCTPQEVRLPAGADSNPSSTVSYPDFHGATSAQTQSASKVKVSWTASSDPKVVAYNIYDATLRFAPVLKKTVSAPISEATLTGLTAQTYYAFRVRAANSANVEDSNTIDVGAIPYGGVLPAQVLTSTSAIIPFTDASNTDKVDIFCATGTSTTFSLMASVTDVSQTQTTLTGLIPGTSYTCRAAVEMNGLTDNNTITTTFIPIGVATQLVFSTQPGSAVAGAPLTPQPVITIKDANGNVVSAGPDSTVPVTLSVSGASPSGGAFTAGATVNAIGGVATFTGLDLTTSGQKILTASKIDTSGVQYGSAALTADSNSFLISPGAVSPASSSITISPAVPPNQPLVANGNNSYAVTILLADKFGNAIPNVKPTFGSSISGDTLSQPAVSTDPSGTTSGSISSTVADTLPPFRTLSITSPNGLTSVQTAAPFVPGPPAKLAYFVQPVNSPAGLLGMASIKVAVEDAQGNVVSTGTAATASISLSIASNVNGASLTGTQPVTASGGVAVFSDLGIDKTQTGYKLLASSGSYTPAYSNSFNITSGTPRKIKVTGPGTVVSGSCSPAYTIQFQDQGNNPANAIQNTPVQLSGLGSALLYNSSSCSGSPISSTLTFTAGTNLKTVYLRDAKGEAISITATDSSAVLTSGTVAINITPDYVSLLAQAAPPAAAGTPLTVVAGKCSTAIYITPQSDNQSPAPLFNVTPMSVTGIGGSQAVLYSDATCATPLTALNIGLPVTSGSGSFSIPIYFLDKKAETLSLGVADPGGVMNQTSGLQTVQVLPSNINFTGPATVVAGKCSTAFTITLKDALGNAVAAASNTSLNIVGIPNSSSALFYTNASCSGTGTASSLTIPASSSQIQVFMSDNLAETLSIHLADPGLQLANSQTVTIGVSPSALQIVTPAGTSSATTVCAGPFKINTLDGANHITAAITPITVNLSGSGTGGVFFLDNTCSAPVTSFTFAAGDSNKTFYFMGQYPAGTLTFTAADAAAVLVSGTANWAVTAAPGWIGSAGTQFNSDGSTIWFTKGLSPISARTDGPSSVFGLHFDSTKQYLYAVDWQSHRIVKYDYLNHKYIGWLGMFNSAGNIGVTGSTLTTPSAAQCVSTASGNTLPGWCTGGFSQANGNNATGGIYQPAQLTDDGTYIYVTNYYGNTVTRYLADTGAFAGYIGRISSTPTAAGNGPNPGPGTCTNTTISAANNPTPGFCMGGSSSNSGNSYFGNGLMNNPRAITYFNNYIFVSTQGAILRFSTTDGSFQGWIGQGSTTQPTSGAAGCTTLGNNQTTPGWCMGGTWNLVNPKSNGGGGISWPTSVLVANNILYVAMTDNNGTISKYDVNSGAYLGYMPNAGGGSWGGPYQMTTDGTDFYLADWSRVIHIDSTGLVLGWVGKVANANSMSGSTGCSTLVPNADTPGWCLGGTSKHGMNDEAFNQVQAIEFDGAGNLITGQGGTFPSIKMINLATGTYQGTLAYKSTSPSQWSNDPNQFAQNYGFDDNSMFAPEFSYNDGTYLYLAEGNASRIKKIDPTTGRVIGWIGGITSVPTGGGAGCTSATAMGPSPNWCLGAWFNPNYLWNYIIGNTVNGIMNYPMGITGDGTYLYVTDYNMHRIQKFQASNGAYIGWIGGINTPPTGGPGSCVGAANGTFTPNWCTGGYPTNGTGNGFLWNPVGITYYSGKLYVVDSNNHRVSSYDASTGAFLGWIGRLNATPTVCTYASNTQYNVSTSKWCMGGTSQAGFNGGDKGGAFAFGGRSGIANDGTYLYIANSGNQRIDKYDFNGNWQGAAGSRYDVYTGTWSNAGATVGAYGCGSPYGVWTDANYIYGTGTSCGTYGSQVWKMNKTTGTIVGWKGTPRSDYPPTAGDPGCAGATVITPGWCQGGGAANGYQIGGFTNAYGISGDANFIYVTDDQLQRMTRLPK